jgi:hypothetical protein
VGFILISLLIFLISYLGYIARIKKTNTNLKGALYHTKTEKILINQNKIATPQENPQKPPVSKSEIIDSVIQKSKKSKFQVFNPKTEKPKIHSPKIIKSNISDEVGKKTK